MPLVFISYSSNDRAAVLPFVEALRSHGLEAWIDVERVVRGSFVEELEQGLDRAEAFLVFWSASFQSRGWTRRELGVITAASVEKRKQLYCVALDSTPKPAFLSDRTTFAAQDSDGAAFALEQTLGAAPLGPRHRAKLASRPVNLLAADTPAFVVADLAHRVLLVRRQVRGATPPERIAIPVAGLGTVELPLVAGALENPLLMDDLQLCFDVLEKTARESVATERDIEDTLEPRTARILEDRLPRLRATIDTRAERLRELLRHVIAM